MSLAHQIMPTGEKPVPSLIRYDAACRAIAEAVAADELKAIRDSAMAMAAAAKIAKNKQAEADMMALRFRAERRLGELMDGQRSAGLLKPGNPNGFSENPLAEKPITLAEAGIDKNLADRARKYAAIPEQEFEKRIDAYRDDVAAQGERAMADLVAAGERAQQQRRANDFYPTPESLIAEIVARWSPRSKLIWEPCAGDGRVVEALRGVGFEAIAGDITRGSDFFSFDAPPSPDVALCTNPPFERVREFIDHAFAIGIREMCLVLPERIWASGVGREQFERHRPAVWVNLDWREDYLGKGGSPDRALAVAIWDSPCAPHCHFDVWTRSAVEVGATNSPEGATKQRENVPSQHEVRPGSTSLGTEQQCDTLGVTAGETAPDEVSADLGRQPNALGAKIAPVSNPALVNSVSNPQKPKSPPAADKAETVAPPAVSAAPLKMSSKADQVLLIRPHCQHPGTDLCGGSGRNHCHSCKKLMAEGEAG